MKKIIFKLLAFAPLLMACDDLFSPAPENIRDIESMYEEPSYAQGFLANAYILLPYQSMPGSDLATDDAVTNENDNSYLKMATGAWAANSDPMSQWQGRYNAIQYVNIVLESCDKIVWANEEPLRTMFNDHFKGECYALRALHMYYLLQAHGGRAADGTLLGVPIHLTSEDINSDFNQPRDTYQKCVEQIMDDIEKALELLPYTCGDITSDNEIPAKYQALGATMAGYNRAFGSHMKGKIDGRVTEALRAQVALLAASPAYNDASGVTWEQAANDAATVLDRIGGISGMDDDGWKWFANTTEIGNLTAGDNPAEIIWRGNMSTANDWESSNYPPSLYGNGRVNPTQNLVDAFPMANGYPITENTSGYNAADPYTGRDPRLTTYIVVNGSKQGTANTEIITGTYGTNSDVINKEGGKSTRTGYYMRKLLRSDVNLNPQSSTTQKHYVARIRYTEIFLAYAEAANEAWGPTGKGAHAYSAYDVIKALRKRAGVGGDDDPYLESIKGDVVKMRELIRNERRLELCFENFRFWDLRRWKVDLSKLNETARGMQISKNADGTLKYTEMPGVEVRNYKDYMYYGPIPYSETLKWSNLQQNQGW